MSMTISTYKCQSCACADISSLGSHSGPVDAMRYFCNHEMRNPYGYGGRSFNKLAPFYVFVAGPEIPGKGHSSKSWVRYGTEFAEFIQNEGLGIVVSPGPKINHKYHPDTTCQTWVWSPDQEAMEKWYKNDLDKTAVKARNVWKTSTT